MRKTIKKALCGLMAGLMVAVTVPAAIPEAAYVTEVQAAARVATPKLVSAKASGKSKIVFKWKAVKGVSGYTVFRKEKGGKWKNVAEVKGAKKTSFSDTKVTTGTQYTYSVKAFKTTKGKKTFSSYNKKGVTAIAGLYTLKLNSSRITLNPGKSYTLKVNGTKLAPAWKSSNSKIAAVNKKGRITAKKAGTAKITATLGGKKFVCTVTVKKASASSNKTVQNYTKVKNYLNKNGRYSEDGSRYIEMAIDADTTAVLSYDPKENKLDMGLTLRVEEENIVSTVDVVVNCAKPDTAKIYSGIFSGGVELYTTANMKPSTYTGKQNITFYNASGSKANTEIQEAANATLQAAMAGTEYILRSKLNMSLKTLGFNAYRL
ncbi:Ig-like domain-containing protein [Blautia obeum]|uniref:Ig-like domain-containing protein n=1 Tax=Blautia obeum TaxID=40520 RepID=UPI00321A3FCD